jgi:hypothetical protein
VSFSEEEKIAKAKPCSFKQSPAYILLEDNLCSCSDNTDENDIALTTYNILVHRSFWYFCAEVVV